MDGGEIELGPELTRATAGDSGKVGYITADAFRDDPFNRWLLGSQGAIAGVFAALARHLYVPRGFSYRLGEEGAAMWMMPGGSIEPPLAALPALHVAVLYRATRGARHRVDRTVAAMTQAHPRVPHAYLFTIGVRPRSQGKGLGRKLIAPVLAACDRAAMPAYLENSNPANHAFYTSCGFASIGPIEPMAGSPPLTAMIRQPRG
jgi:GNAT superfamily N-acetyltransferase